MEDLIVRGVEGRRASAIALSCSQYPWEREDGFHNFEGKLLHSVMHRAEGGDCEQFDDEVCAGYPQGEHRRD